MSDADLEAIRQARRQELQSQQGGGGSQGPGRGGQEDEQKYGTKRAIRGPKRMCRC